MNINEIQDLIAFVAKSGVSEVEIERKDFKLIIKSEKPEPVFVQATAPQMVPAPVALPTPVPAAGPGLALAAATAPTSVVVSSL